MMYQLTIHEYPENICTIAKTAMGRLQASPYHILRKISCECKDGVLTLKGNLLTFYEKQIAQETVSSVEGMTQVVNEIAVEGGNLDDATNRMTGQFAVSYTQGRTIPQAEGVSHVSSEQEVDGKHLHQ
jgi:hypothetical protein